MFNVYCAAEFLHKFPQGEYCIDKIYKITLTIILSP